MDVTDRAAAVRDGTAGDYPAILALNQESARFHQRYGFREVGQQELAGSGKVVSLQAVMLPSSRETAPLSL